MKIKPGNQSFTLVIFTLILTIFGNLSAHTPKYPVDVSFLIVDMKYSRDQGVQICELQHGVPSTFKGEKFSYGKSYVAENLLKNLNRFYSLSWMQYTSFADTSVILEFKNDPQWIPFKGINKLANDERFILAANTPVEDPYDLKSYHGFLFISPGNGIDRESLARKYPGIVVIDNSNFELRRDKLGWSNLLLDHPLLLQHKPAWKAYEKTYTKSLVDEIIQDIPSDIFVIKPVGKYLGRGVIIVERENLNETLKYILKVSQEKPPGYDPSFDEWFNDNSEHFIVEAFADSDPVSVPHLDGKVFSPTMRLAFLLFYDNQSIKIVCLGGYYSLPQKALDEEGTLNEKYKSFCKLPHYCKADPEAMQEGENQLIEILTIVYQRMLGLTD